MHSQMTPNTAPSRASYGASSMSSSEKYSATYGVRIVHGNPFRNSDFRQFHRYLSCEHHSKNANLSDAENLQTREDK